MGVGKRLLVVAACILAAPAAPGAFAQDGGNVSSKSQSCLMCHKRATPNIVASWSRSRMAQVTPAEALKKPEPQRRISVDKAPEGMAESVVGCAECHTMKPDSHGDSFAHQGFEVHTVVSPQDCAACHPVEQQQFAQNIMHEAYGNLQDNAVYADLVKAANGPLSFAGRKLSQKAPDARTNADSCLFCHGTRLEVEEMASRDTDFGPMEFPVISGWPNQGVGRINPDGSKGSCSACHSRHQFAIEMARKPYTCGQCHKGPDVPAYKVYKVSKHSNIVDSLAQSGDWDFSAVPWTVGEDFTAPTCATCHVSKVASPDGRIRAERTHRMNDRLGWRIFGLIYAHAHPKSPDTAKIENKNGLPLPTALDGTPASEYLISGKEREERIGAMKAVCGSCHSGSWVDGHFERFAHTIETTNNQTRVATEIMQEAWKQGAASAADSLFNEALERRWVEQWLFYGNSVRFASAMMGADYGVFANGRWEESKNPHAMLEGLLQKLKAAEK